ncbi:MAG: hypothetical protein H6581_27940 [Bacteroidia bacterium]|nr:hypothetical protein [Bacteroidia bacterium]
MKAIKQKAIFLGVITIILALLGCQKPYLENFAEFTGKEISFLEEGLPAKIKSPFDGEMVHPLGMVELQSSSGELYFLTFINTIPNREVPELGGGVFAEIIVGKRRVEKLEVAWTEVGIYEVAKVNLPEIEVITETSGDLHYSSTYRVTISGFERIKTDDPRYK